MGNWLHELLLSEPVSTWLVTALAAAGAWLARWQWIRRWRLERAAQCLEAGVRQTYEEYVRVCKAASDDGKLDSEQRAEAMRRALEAAETYARREGIDLLKQYAKDYLPVLVDRFIRGVQGESRLARWVPLPFGDGSSTDSSDNS